MMTPVDMMINIFLKTCENFHWEDTCPNFLKAPSLEEKLEHVKLHLALINEKSFHFKYIPNQVKYVLLLEGVLEEIEKALIQEYLQEAELLKSMFWDRCKSLRNFTDGTYTFSDVDWAFSINHDYKRIYFIYECREHTVLNALQDQLEEIREKINYLNQVKKHFGECFI